MMKAKACSAILLSKPVLLATIRIVENQQMSQKKTSVKYNHHYCIPSTRLYSKQPIAYPTLASTTDSQVVDSLDLSTTS